MQLQISQKTDVRGSAAYTLKLKRLKEALENADAVLVGAGAGLSTSAGFTYSCERFNEHFADFAEKYHFADMYSGGFFPYATPEETWAFWSRNIWYNRYVDPPRNTYELVRKLVEGKPHFALTTNVDHCFQKASWDKDKLFYTQGDYGLWQCSVPCHSKTYDNYGVVKQMIEQQRDMRVPSELVPTCPRCGEPMSMNLRADNTFVEDEGWHAAAERYQQFLQEWGTSRIVYLELGVGGNTPSIIKYPFWRLTSENPQATYACVNLGEAYTPEVIAEQCILMNADIHGVLEDLVGA